MAKKLQRFNTIFSTYQAVDQVGSGGSGTVYKVIDEQNEIYAIKCLDPSKIERKRVKRFRNELFFCLKNEHRNIIKVIDWGSIEINSIACPFYVMPFYSQTLRSLIKSKINPDHVLPLFAQMLDAVECAHLKQVFHRDIKPENFLFNSETNTIVLCDFGIAHFAEEILHTIIQTNEGERLANFQYAAPEQRARAQMVDYRTDIYSLGLILNEMFTNHIPLGTDFRKVFDTSPDYAYLDDLIEAMLRQSPNTRIQSIGEIKKQLIGRKNNFIVQQTLDKLKKQVIPTSELNDYLITNPPRLADVDYRNGDLILELSSKPNVDWIYAFHTIGNYESFLGKGPRNFQFFEKNAVISSSEDTAPQLVEYFKSYIQKANDEYKIRKTNEKRSKEEAERNELRKEIEETERRSL